MEMEMEMEMEVEMAIDIASYPEYENLVVEIYQAPDLAIVLSKEPCEQDYKISFFGGAASSAAPSFSKPSDENRFNLAQILAAIEKGRDALENQSRRTNVDPIVRK